MNHQQQQQISETSAKILLSDTATITAKLYHAVSVLHDDADQSEGEGGLLIFTSEPETILVMLQQQLGREIPPLSRAKLLLGIMAYTSNYIYNEIKLFIEFANYCVSDNPPLVDVWDPANAFECGAAIIELELINNDLLQTDPDDFQFNEEIRRYIGGVLYSESILKLAKPYDVAILPDVQIFDSPALAEVIVDNDRQNMLNITSSLAIHLTKIFRELSSLKSVDGQQVFDQAMQDKYLSALGM